MVYFRNVLVSVNTLHKGDDNYDDDDDDDDDDYGNCFYVEIEITRVLIFFVFERLKVNEDV
jgi:hypothetical protein